MTRRSYDADVRLNEPETSNDYIGTLLKQVFVRLSLEENHGKLLVERALGYLAAARRGLSETEVLEVLFADIEYKKQLDTASKDNNHTLPTEPPRIPVTIWFRLRSDLAPYLTERAAPGGNVLTFYHRQVAEWVKHRFVEQSEWKPHERLVDFFAKQEYFNEPLEQQRLRQSQPPYSPRRVNVRKVDELPRQRLQAHQWGDLGTLFTSLAFLEAKNEAGLTLDLAADFQATVDAMPRDEERHRILRILNQALGRAISFIARHREDYPQALFQCLWNACYSSEAVEAHDSNRSRARQQ